MTKKFRPITPSLRKLVLPTFKNLQPAKKKTKQLLEKKQRINGRNHHGHITCRHRGGGHKKHYRVVDFKRDKFEMPAKVAGVEYDPNRTCFLALLHYSDGEKRYILAPQGLKVGDEVMTTESLNISVGNCLRLKDMPLGSFVHNIELYPGRGGILVRSAGTSAQLLARSEGMASIKMPSSEVRLISENCRATLGSLSNPEHMLRVDAKAGRTRWKGIRPTVRGTVMNPVDHPHGGGEGKSKGNIPQSPWAQFAKGFKTRSKQKSNKMIIKKRIRKKRK